jgi:protein-tyrosine phosphatase
MIDNFSWVIAGKLAGSAIPDEAYSGRAALSGSGGRLPTDLADLHARGIRCLVSLTDRAEDLGSHCRAVGLEWHYYPIPDFGIPDSIKSFDDLITTIIDSMNKNGPVCVHCFAGVGRTGLVLCCTVGRYLQLPAVRAIPAVRKIRSALETREQESFVQRYLDRYSDKNA